MGTVRSEDVESAIRSFFYEFHTDMFHMEELRDFVIHEVGKLAPDTPGRVMRGMRQRGAINYEVLSRSESLYRQLPVQR